MLTERLKEFVHQNLSRFSAEIMRLASVPSVSAKREAVDECADLVEEMMKAVGLRTRVLRLNGASPLLYGEMKSSKSAKTILFYNHYDVQPVDPIEQWKSPPFKPEVRDGRIYGRGVSDDKGELISRLKILESYVSTEGEPPCNLKFCFDGEEETGSNHLNQYLAENEPVFKADAVFWEWGGVDELDRPVVQLGVKGNLVLELYLRCLSGEAHGKTSAALPSAPWRMVHLLGKIRDERGRVLIPGWYDEVEKLTPSEQEILEAEPFDAEQYLETYGARSFIDGMSPTEAKAALVTKPTANISGLWSGYLGEGVKGIVPAEAHCKMNFQLVQNQDPDHLLTIFRKFLKKTDNQDVEIISHRGSPAARTSPDSTFAQACIKAGRNVYRKNSVVRLSASGSGPLYMVAKRYNIPAVSVGVSAPDSGMHGPNENLRLDLLEKGILWISETIEQFVGPASAAS